MNKGDLINKIAEGAEIPKTKAGAALDAVLQAITDALKSGDKVSLIGFGTFSVTERAAREGINPSTKQKIQIPAKKVAKFKPGAELKRAIEE